MYFPILIDLTKFKAVVIGGGKVSLRKIKNLLEFDCKPDIISPIVVDELKEIIEKNELNLIKRKYQYGDLKNYSLVFASTGDSDADLLIEKECNELGILLNVADVPDLCNFIVPANIRRGFLTFSLASQGNSPFLVKFLKEKIEKTIPDEYSYISELAKELRNYLMNDIRFPDEKSKQAHFDSFLAIDWVNLIRNKGFSAAKEKLQGIIYELNDG